MYAASAAKAPEMSLAELSPQQLSLLQPCYLVLDWGLVSELFM